MSEIEKFEGRRYEIYAWFLGHKIITYVEFGSYQGEWAMVSADDSQYFIWKGHYGSCSGCDSFESEMRGYDDDQPWTRDNPKVIEFCKGERPTIEIPKDTMKNLVISGNMKTVFPANFRDEYSEIDLDRLVDDTIFEVKLREGMDITVSDVIACKNQETKQRMLRHVGYERFVEEAKPDVLDRDGENQLLRVGDIVFAYVKDSSTPRRYLLRVPPQMVRVKQAIAWTFDVPEHLYSPLVES